MKYTSTIEDIKGIERIEAWLLKLSYDQLFEVYELLQTESEEDDV